MLSTESSGGSQGLTTGGTTSSGGSNQGSSSGGANNPLGSGGQTNSGGAAAASGGAAPLATGGATPGTGGSMPGTGGTTAGGNEIPCDVQEILALNCQGCHREDSLYGSLMTLDDLLAPSKTDESQTVAEVSVSRTMSSTDKPMPPPSFEALTGDQVTTLLDWVTAGATGAACATVTPPADDPYDTPEVCTSGQEWTMGHDLHDDRMVPGTACVKCHSEDPGARGHELWLGGTVYPTAHEPNLCYGVDESSGAKVVITDAAGTVYELDVNGTGNFYINQAGTNFQFPYTAKVVVGDKERVMLTPQDDGDCNNCHTVQGVKETLPVEGDPFDTPGRIFLP